MKELGLDGLDSSDEILVQSIPLGVNEALSSVVSP
jgi:hypothetical protein